MTLKEHATRHVLEPAALRFYQLAASERKATNAAAALASSEADAHQDASKALEEVVNSMVDAQLQPRVMVRAAQAPAVGRALPQPAQVRPALPRNRQTIADGAKLLRESLAAVIKKHLSPEQWSRYQAEVEKRNAGRKQVAIRYLVDSLDHELYLSDQQHTQRP